MAPTENSNQSSSEPEGDDNKSEEVQPETDPSNHLESTVSGSDEIVDPSTEGVFQGKT